MSKLADCVGGSDFVQELLSPLELLSSMEETPIREKAIDSIRFVASCGGGGCKTDGHKRQLDARSPRKKKQFKEIVDFVFILQALLSYDFLHAVSWRHFCLHRTWTNFLCLLSGDWYVGVITIFDSIHI